MRIAINGMGRIGRLLFRRLIHDDRFTLVAVNDIMPGDNLAYLLQYDSLYGTWPEDIVFSNGRLQTRNKLVMALQEPDPINLDWRTLDIDVVLECSGRFAQREAAGRHLQAGARKVLLSTTGSADLPLWIYGFNNPGTNDEVDILSPGGCMTNCSTPVLDILQPLGIESAQLNILHSYTSRQELVDTAHRQFRRGRAAAESIIPVEIDLASSLERLFPELHGKLATMSVRVPVTNGAMADITVQLSGETSREAINQRFRDAANNGYHGVVAYTEAPLVSADIRGNTHSCIIDGTLTAVAGRQVKIIAWFDNEYGYTSRIIDWLLFWRNR